MFSYQPLLREFSLSYEHERAIANQRERSLSLGLSLSTFVSCCCYGASTYKVPNKTPCLMSVPSKYSLLDDDDSHDDPAAADDANDS